MNVMHAKRMVLGDLRKADPSQGENPYLNARTAWNEQNGAVMGAARAWQLVAIASLAVAALAVTGALYLASQSQFIPYVVEVDKLGQVGAAQALTATSPVDPRIVRATIASFITNARTVTPDVSLQRKAIFSVYATLSMNDPALARMNEWLNADAERTPFKRAAKEMVETQITSVLPQSGDAWQVDWTETTRDRQGALISRVSWRALVSVYIADTSALSEEQIQQNPLGIYVRDFNWQRLI